MSAPKIDLDGWVAAMTQADGVAEDSGVSLPVLCTLWRMASRYRFLLDHTRWEDEKERNRLYRQAHEILAMDGASTEESLRVVYRFFHHEEPPTVQPEQADDFEEVPF